MSLASRPKPEVWDSREFTFPPSLAHLRYRPECLWTLGDRGVLAAPTVAVVGTRRMTSYGERATRTIAGALARAGACVVSGMAVGVDATAHRAALEVGGRTAAVLGTGVDVPYPVGHHRLHKELAERGLVVSEMEPGARAGKGSFPRRNRLIAALAKLVIVVEAPARSGALLTVNEGLELGRPIAAVPGPIDAPQSAGTNALLLDGAQIITCANDALALLGLSPEPQTLPVLSPDQQRVWQVLTDAGSGPVEMLVARTGMPLREILETVTALEIRGIVCVDHAGSVRLR